MHTDTQEDFPLPSFRSSWPKDFLEKRRKFDRKDENTPYIEFVKLSFLDNEDEEEDDDSAEEEEVEKIEDAEGDRAEALGVEVKHENRQDDKDTPASEALSTTRVFMKGMIGDEDALEYPDQVEEVAGFSEQPRIPEFEKCGALLEDHCGSGGTLHTSGYSRPYFGPLTPHQLRDELSKKRFRIESDKDDLRNVFDDDGSDAEIRRVFVTDLNPSSIEAITATAPRSHAAALKNLFYRYITGEPSIGVNISTHGFRVYTLEFNIPYFRLEESLTAMTDPRKKADGRPLRQSLDLPFLSGARTGSLYRLYQEQMSVAVTGIDQWVWTAYGLFDTHCGWKESVLGYDALKVRMGRADPLGAGQIPAHSMISTPREYFFKIFEIRINQVRREWHKIVAKMESEMKLSRTKHVFPLLSNDAKARQEARDSSRWSTQMVGLLRLLISCLSPVVDVWEEFCRGDMGYFLYDGDSPAKSAPLQSSIGAVNKAFVDLRSLRRKLRELKSELCENNPQGLNAHLGFGSHDAAIFQQKSASHIQVLTVMTIVFTPLALAIAMFSTQGVLPFTPNLARFTYAFLILAAMVLIMLIILYNWAYWFQPVIDGFVHELKSLLGMLHHKKQPGVEAVLEHNAASTGIWPNALTGRLRMADLEEGLDPEEG